MVVCGFNKKTSNLVVSTYLTHLSFSLVYTCLVSLFNETKMSVSSIVFSFFVYFFILIDSYDIE